MSIQFRRMSGAALGVLLLGLVPVEASAASAAPAGAVPFGQAVFNGYANGTELHASALTAGTTTLADVDQGFSGASTSTAGLTSQINAVTGSIVQPVQPASVKAYGTGTGLEVGIGTSTTATVDPHQVLLAGKAEQVAPPNSTTVTKQIGPIDASPVLAAEALTGRASAIFDPAQCPIGQPISYGIGLAAGVNALYAAGVPVVGLTGAGTSVAQSTSDTFLSSNGDGTFGLTSEATNIIAPLSVNIPSVGALQVTVAGDTPNTPITLDAVAPGKAAGGAVTLQHFKTVTVALVAGGTTTTIISKSLTDILGNGGTLSLPLAVGPISLGTLDLDAKPHAIGGPATSAPVVVGGTSASGAVDIVHLGVAPKVAGVPIPNFSVLDFFLGHLEAKASLAASMTCSIPVIKTANPTSVLAGSPFTYTIQVPDPAKLALLDCDLVNISVTDTIRDKQGNPAFQVTSASNGGAISQTSANMATITWTGLKYTVAAHGQPPNMPITLTINVQVPATSTAGIISDSVSVAATAQNCHGGGSNIQNVGAINSTVLTGTFELDQPSVAAAAATSLPGTTPTTLPLPITGAMGGPWQPIAGLGVLGLGGAALALVRRNRRRLDR